MARILLVEDNEMNRDLLRRRLERSGFTVLLAVNGQDAIDTARAQQPDLILMDLGLPVVDGWTAISTLKADPSTRSTPIIALSGHVMAADQQRAFESGCEAFQAKPVDMVGLLSDMQRLLSPGPAATPHPPV